MPEPPEAVSCWLKLSPTVSTGRVVGFIVIAGSTVIEYDRSPVALMLSVTVTSIVYDVTLAGRAAEQAGAAERQACGRTRCREAVATTRAARGRELVTVVSPTVAPAMSSGSCVIAGSTVIEYDRSPVALMLSVTVTSIV